MYVMHKKALYIFTLCNKKQNYGHPHRTLAGHVDRNCQLQELASDDKSDEQGTTKRNIN